MQDISHLITSLKDLIQKEDFNAEEKENVLDDLETIELEVVSENPRSIKIKKAYQGIINFIAKIPQGLTTATLIAT